jgi:hypothetical protein
MLPPEILMLIGSFVDNIDTRRMLRFNGANRLPESLKENLKNIVLPKPVYHMTEKCSVHIYGWRQDVYYIIRKLDSIFEVINLKGQNKIEKWRLNPDTNVWLKLN